MSSSSTGDKGYELRQQKLETQIAKEQAKERTNKAENKKLRFQLDDIIKDIQIAEERVKNVDIQLQSLRQRVEKAHNMAMLQNNKTELLSLLKVVKNELDKTQRNLGRVAKQMEKNGASKAQRNAIKQKNSIDLIRAKHSH